MECNFPVGYLHTQPTLKTHDARPPAHHQACRSPQSYAYDRYYFARAGQLYMIVIGHFGDREDWALYNHFLGSFQFGA